MRKEVIIASTVGLLCMLELCATTEVDSLDMAEVSPYLLFATTVHIYRMNLDGSGVEVLVYERNFGILGLEYHYRLDSLFWTNIYEPSIKQANLDGSNIRTIVTNGPGDLELYYPVDLAVDWINNKLYWTDRDVKKIGVYDLVTAERRVILSTGGTGSLPFGLAVYPFPDYGWLYWVDRGEKTLEVAAVTGEGREVLESGRRVSCAWPLTLDYSEHTVYWINYCDSRMLSISMDGSQSSKSVHVTNAFFPYGISIFNSTIFWTQEQSAYSVDILQRKPVTHILQTSSSDGGARGIAAVHPMQQPTAEVFRMIVDTGTAVCDPPCANGVCIDPGLCYCDRGWTGPDCLKALATPSPSFTTSSSFTVTKSSANTVFSFVGEPRQSSIPPAPRQSSTPRQSSIPSTPRQSSIPPTPRQSSIPSTPRQSSIPSTPRQSSIPSTPRQSSVPPTITTTPPIILLPSSKKTTSTVVSSPIAQSEEVSTSTVTKSSTYFDAAATTLIVTSSLAELTSSSILNQGTSIQTVNIIPSSSTRTQSSMSPPNSRTLSLQTPLHSNSIPVLPSSAPVGDTTDSTSATLTLTRPEMSMDSSPRSSATKPESGGFTLAVVVAAVFAGVLLLTVVVAVIICIVAAHQQKARKSRSWNPPRSTGDLPLTPLTGSMTATPVAKEAS